MKGLRKKNKQPLPKKLTDTDNSIMITREKGGWGQVEEDKGG